MPAGGYTSRPSWYPTLTQVFGVAEPTCAPSSISFTSPVIPIDKLAPSIPYGMMISEHVTPIDHGYLGLTSLSIPVGSRTESDYVKVTAPADGVITELSPLGRAGEGSNRVTISHGCGLWSVYMVLNRPSGLLASAYQEMLSKGSVKVNIAIKAGQEFGMQRDNALDFNVFSSTEWLSGFVGLSSYLPFETWKPYTADYLPFFSGAIRTAMENVLQKTSAPRVGKIDHDVAGAASGNWFLAGTYGYSGHSLATYQNATSEVHAGSVAGKNIYAWGHLAIAPHWVDSSQWILSTGWKDNPAGDSTQFLLVVGAGGIAPSALKAANGTVVYQLASIGKSYDMGAGSTAPAPVGYTVSAGQSQGTVALRVNADDTLSLEFGLSAGQAFTSAARTYTR